MNWGRIEPTNHSAAAATYLAPFQPLPPRRQPLNGLGNTTEQIVMTAPQIAGGVLTAGGSGSIAAGLWGAAAVPIIGGIVVGATLALSALFARKGPKQKVATTQVVDAVEPHLRDNLDGYFSGPRTVSSQRQALANFDAGWQYVLENCGQTVMGEPGRRCIDERQPGGRWDWFALYRDPIANDPEVMADPILPTLSQFNLDQVTRATEEAGVPWLVPVVGGLLVLAAVAG